MGGVFVPKKFSHRIKQLKFAGYRGVKFTDSYRKFKEDFFQIARNLIKGVRVD